MQLLMHILSEDTMMKLPPGWAAIVFSTSDFLLRSFVAIWARELFVDLTVARASKSDSMKKG